MATFNAGDVVEPLDWDFTGRDKDGHVPKGWPRELSTAKGTIKEPSDQAIGVFLEDVRNLSTDAARLDAQTRKMIDDLSSKDQDPDKFAAALKELPVTSMMTMMEGMAEAFSKLCSGHPTKNQIMALPLRVRVAFFNWMQQEVVNPEAGSGGGIAPVISLPAAAGGSSST
jgi:hypothetical protein